MDFSLIFELQTRAPRSPTRDHTLFWDAIEQAVHADRAGFSHVWAVEHHFREEFSHNSAPELWLTAVAQRTERIRVGHGVVQTLPQFNHPVRVLERVNVLDILSNGRVDFGSGRAVNLHELGGWGITGDTREMWLESVTLMTEIWKAGYEPVDFEGKYVTFKDRGIMPMCVQQPHPPLWVAATSPDSYRIAGELGMGVLAFGMAINAEAMGRQIGRYREALATGTPLGAFKNDRMAIFMMAYCAESRDEAIEIARDSFNWYLSETLRHFLGWGGGNADMPKGYEWYQKAMSEGAEKAAARNFDYLLEGGMILCGTPDDLIEQIERFEAVGADQMIMGTAIGDISQEDILRSIDLVGEAVIPHFQRKYEQSASGARAGRASS